MSITVNIAIFCWEYHPRIVGGLGTYICEVSPRIVRRGHNVSIFTMNDGTLKTREVIQGVEVHRPLLTDISNVLSIFAPESVKTSSGDRRFLADILVYNLLSASKLVNDPHTKESLEFDLVVVHDWLGIPAGITASAELGRRMVVHVHSTERGRRLGAGMSDIEEIEKIGFLKADGVVTVSRAMKTELDALHLPSDGVEVIHNGVDPQEFDPGRVRPAERERIRKTHGLRDGDPLILYTGWIDPIKGVDRLILAMKEVIRAHPRAKLLLLGTSTDSDWVERLVAECGLNGHVIKVDPSQHNGSGRIDFYSACDLCVFPSLYEPFGLNVLEAMSMQKPVVVGAAGMSGMRETVLAEGPERNGIHVNPYDTGEISGAVIRLIEDRGEAEYMGRNGRKRVLGHYTWEKTVDDTLGYYTKVVGRA